MDSDFVHLLEDLTKMKIPSEIQPPLTYGENLKWTKWPFWRDIAEKSFDFFALTDEPCREVIKIIS